MKIYGKYVDYLKVCEGRLLVTEVRPVPLKLSCTRQSTHNGTTTKTDKWMQLHHWQDLQVLLDNIVKEYEAATAALQPTESFVGDTITRKSGQHVRIAYKWRENRGSRCFYLSSADTESSDSSSDDEDLEDKWLQKRLQHTEARGFSLSSWQPCGVVLVVSVAPHVPAPTVPSENLGVESCLPSLSSPQPDLLVIDASADAEPDQDIARKLIERPKKHLERSPPNRGDGHATNVPACPDESSADDDDVLLSDRARPAKHEGVPDVDTSQHHATQLLMEQPSNQSMDQICEQLREVRKAKRKKTAGKIKANYIDRPVSKRQEKYAVFDNVSSEEIKLVLSSNYQPVSTVSLNGSLRNVVCDNSSRQVTVSSSTSVLPVRSRPDITFSSSQWGINRHNEIPSTYPLPVSSFQTIPLDTGPTQLLPAATTCDGAVSLSQKLTQTLDSTLPSIDGSDMPCSSHNTHDLDLGSPPMVQHERRDKRMMHLSPSDLKHMTFCNASHLGHSQHSLSSTLPSLESTPVPVTLPDGVKTLHKRFRQQIHANGILHRDSVGQISYPDNVEKNEINERKHSLTPVKDEISVLVTDVTGYKDELQSPVSPTQYNPFCVDPLPGIESSVQPSDEEEQDCSDHENLDPVTVLSMAPMNCTSVDSSQYQPCSSSDVPNILTHKILPSVSLHVSTAATRLYDSPQTFDDSSDRTFLNDYGQEFSTSNDLLNQNIDLNYGSSDDDDDDEIHRQLVEHVSTDSVCKLVVNGTDAETLSDYDSDVIRIESAYKCREGPGLEVSDQKNGCEVLEGVYPVQGGFSLQTEGPKRRKFTDGTTPQQFQNNSVPYSRSSSQTSYANEHFFEECSQPTTSADKECNYVNEAVSIVSATTTTTKNSLKCHRRKISEERRTFSNSFSDEEPYFAEDLNINRIDRNKNASFLETMIQKSSSSEEVNVDNESASRESQVNRCVGSFEPRTSKYNNPSSPILGLSKKMSQAKNSEQLLVHNEILHLPPINHLNSVDLSSNKFDICTPTLPKMPKQFSDNFTNDSSTIDNPGNLNQFSTQQIADTRPFYLGTSLELSDSPVTASHSTTTSLDANPCTKSTDTVKLRTRCFNDDESQPRKLSSDSPQKLSIIKKIFSAKKQHPVVAVQTAKKSTKRGKVVVRTDDTVAEVTSAETLNSAGACASGGEMNKPKCSKINVNLQCKKSARSKKNLLNNPSDGSIPDKYVTKRRPHLSKTSQLSLLKNSPSKTLQFGVKEPHVLRSPLKESHTEKIITNTFSKVRIKNVCTSNDSAFERVTETCLDLSASVKLRTPNRSKLVSNDPCCPEAAAEGNSDRHSLPSVLKSSPVTAKCSPEGAQSSYKNFSCTTSASKPGVVESLVDPTEFGRQMGMLDKLYSKDSSKKRKNIMQDCSGAPSPKQRKMTDHFPKESTGNLAGIVGADAGTTALLRRANLEDVDESDEEELPDIHTSVDPNDSFRSTNSQGPSDIEADSSCSKYSLVEGSCTIIAGPSHGISSKQGKARTSNPLQEVYKVDSLTATSDTESPENGACQQITSKLVHVKVTDDKTSSIALTKPARRCRKKPMRFMSPDLMCPDTALFLNETLPNLCVSQRRSVDGKRAVDSIGSSSLPSPSVLSNDVASVSRKEVTSSTSSTAPASAKSTTPATVALTAPTTATVQEKLKGRKRLPSASKGGRAKKNYQKKPFVNNERSQSALMENWLSKRQKGCNAKTSSKAAPLEEGIKVKRNKIKPSATKKDSVQAASEVKELATVVGVERENNDLTQDDDKLLSQLPDITKPCESTSIETTVPILQTKPPKRKYNKKNVKKNENLSGTESSSSSLNTNVLKTSSGLSQFGSCELLSVNRSSAKSSTRSPTKSCNSSKNSRSTSSPKLSTRASTSTDCGEDETDLFNYSIDSWGNTVSPKKGGRLTDDETVVVEDNTLDLPQEDEDGENPLLAMLLSSAEPEQPTPSHLEPERMREVVHAMRRKYDCTALLRWLPEQLSWLTKVLRGTEDNEWHQMYLKGPVAMDQLPTFRYYGVLEKTQIRTITDFLAVHLDKELKRALRHDPRPTHMYTWRVQVPLVATLMCRAVSGLSWDHSTDLLLSANRGGALDDD